VISGINMTIIPWKLGSIAQTQIEVLALFT